MEIKTITQEDITEAYNKFMTAHNNLEEKDQALADIKTKMEEDDELSALKNNEAYKQNEILYKSNKIILDELYTIITSYTYTDFNKLLENIEFYMNKSETVSKHLDDLINNFQYKGHLKDFEEQVNKDKLKLGNYNNDLMNFANRFKDFEIEETTEFNDFKTLFASVYNYFIKAKTFKTFNEISEYPNIISIFFANLEQSKDLTRISLNKAIKNLVNYYSNEISETYYNIIRNHHQGILKANANDLFVNFKNLEDDNAYALITPEYIDKLKEIKSNLESLSEQEA